MAAAIFFSIYYRFCFCLPHYTGSTGKEQGFAAPLSGRVAQDIKLIETSNDSHVITINLAVKSDYYKAGEEPKTR